MGTGDGLTLCQLQSDRPKSNEILNTLFVHLTENSIIAELGNFIGAAKVRENTWKS